LRELRLQKGSTVQQLENLSTTSDMETRFSGTNASFCPAIVLWKAQRRNAWLALFRRAGDI
jgi:hypothetical protein